MSKPWFTKTVLDSGLSVFVASTDSPSVAVVFLIKTGSKNELPREHGISHVLEHFVFRGTKKYPDSRDVMRALDSIGAEHNAGTGKEYTVYWVKTAKENLKRALEVINELVFHPTLPEALLSKEKGTILQEIAMYEDHPMAKVDDRFENLMFGKSSRLGRDISGTKESVSAITREQLVRYRQRRYRPEHSVLTIAGGVDVEDALQTAKTSIGKNWEIRNSSAPERPLGPLQEPPKTRRLVEWRKIDQVHLALGVKGLKRIDPRRYALGVFLTILGGNSSSQLFQEIREKRGWAYYVRSGATKFEEDGFVAVRAGVPPEHAHDVVELVTERMSTFSFTDTELQEAISYLKGHLALSWEDSQTIADHLAEEYLFEPEIRSFDALMQKLDAVTRDDVQHAVASLLGNNKEFYIAAIGPVDEELKPKTTS